MEIDIHTDDGWPAGNGVAAASFVTRQLHNCGTAVTVTLPSCQLDTVERLGPKVRAEPAPADLIVDALIGYGLSRNLAGRFADLIDWANAASAPVLALDMPSGLEPSTTPRVQANATMTLALPKLGFGHAASTGASTLADSSVPPVLFAAMGDRGPNDLHIRLGRGRWHPANVVRRASQGVAALQLIVSATPASTRRLRTGQRCSVTSTTWASSAVGAAVWTRASTSTVSK